MLSGYKVIYEYKQEYFTACNIKQKRNKVARYYSDKDIKHKYKKKHHRRMYLVYDENKDRVESIPAKDYEEYFGKPTIDRSCLTKLNLGSLNHCMHNSNIHNIIRNIEIIRVEDSNDVDEINAIYWGMIRGARGTVSDEISLVSNESPDMQKCYMFFDNKGTLCFLTSAKYIMLPKDMSRNNTFALAISNIVADDLDLSMFLLDPNTTDITSLFEGIKVKNLDISNFDMSNINCFSFAFRSLYLQSIKFSPVCCLRENELLNLEYKDAFLHSNMKSFDFRFMDVSRINFAKLAYNSSAEELWLRGTPKYNTVINLYNIFDDLKRLYLNEELYEYIMRHKKSLLIRNKYASSSFLTLYAYRGDRIVKSCKLPKDVFGKK